MKQLADARVVTKNFADILASKTYYFLYFNRDIIIHVMLVGYERRSAIFAIMRCG